MKKILKIVGVCLLVLATGLLVFGWIVHEPLPEGESGDRADDLAQKMLTALNYRAYQDTRFLEWSYRNGANSYRWDKRKGICTVNWNQYEAILNLDRPNQGRLIKKGQSHAHEEDKKELLSHALKLFHNDSFWLVAPYKVFDKGTKRQLVTLENGDEALLVTYTSGGTTPGDSYLWLLNENGFPRAFKMWVKIIPIGGLEASWDDWLVTETGAYLPKTHKLGPITLSMGDVKGNNK